MAWIIECHVNSETRRDGSEQQSLPSDVSIVYETLKWSTRNAVDRSRLFHWSRREALEDIQ